MNLLKIIVSKIERYTLSPIKYARKKGVTIGSNCKLNGHPNWGSEPYLIDLGNHVELSGDVAFITHDGATWCFRDEEKYKNVIRYGKISIKDNCFIGMRSTIMPGVSIGPNSIVGTGSLVTKDVPEGCVYAGIPARFICTMEEYKQKCLQQTPQYDVNFYCSNKREAILRMMKDR
jgi:acetyltransferase-like isoleucine patch superfamily enzyme